MLQTHLIKLKTPSTDSESNMGIGIVIAVVVPVAVVAILLLAAFIWAWRHRKEATKKVDHTALAKRWFIWNPNQDLLPGKGEAEPHES
jgi:heme/copper-type cytochrome/quinol oxidase subunit 2